MKTPLYCLSGRKHCDRITRERGGWRCSQYRRIIQVADLPAKRLPPLPLVADAGPRPEITTRHLIYHIYPNRSRDVWLRNVRQLRRRHELFNGRCIFAVALGPETHRLPVVQATLEWPGAEWMPIENDPVRQDTASFLPMLETIQTIDPHAAVFYAHTKGTWSTAGDAKGIEYWRNAMYANLLDRWPDVATALRTHAAAGTHKFTWCGHPGFPSGYDPPHRWMFAGTFFWFRCDSVFSRRNWRNVRQEKFGGEGWLAEMFPPEEAASLYQPWPEERSPGNSYDPAIYEDPIHD